jgi:fructose-1,6-bisphosphatase II
MQHLPHELTCVYSDLRLIEFDLLRAAEMAALNCIPWFGKGDKEAADAAACDAIRGMFDRIDMRGEIIIGEGIKDDAPGLFEGERVGTWRPDSPRLDIAIDPLDGTTNLSKGLPNSICCIAASLRTEDGIPVLQSVPAFYMKKLAYPSIVRKAWIDDPMLPLDINAPISEVIKLTARLLNKSVRDVVVMLLDRPRNAYLIEEIRLVGASLRMITDGDISAALAPALSNHGVDLYAGIGGAPEGILAAAGLRCLGGGMQAQMWPRDDDERRSLVECGWSGKVNKVYRSRDLVHGDDVLFVATGISDSPLLRGVRVQGSTLVTHSVVMRQLTGSIRFIRAEHDLAKRPIRLRSATSSAVARQILIDSSSDIPRSPDKSNRVVSVPSNKRIAVGRAPAMVLFGAPGSGKGTIGRALASLPQCTHFSSGDVIRAAIAKTSDQSPQDNRVARGALLSDAELFELFDEYLKNYFAGRTDAGEYLLIDGIPRCVSQIKALDERVDVRGVFYLDCGDPKVLVERLRCRFAVSGRSDDADEAVMLERLRLFHVETLPLLDEYPNNVVHRIDATQSPAMVLRDILNRFEQSVLSSENRQLQAAC